MQQEHWTDSRLNPRAAGALAIVLAAVVAVCSFLISPYILLYAAYVIPIVLCLWTRSRKFLWTLALCAALITLARIIIAGYPVPPPLHPNLWLINRILSVVTLLAWASVIHVLMGLIETLHARTAELAQKSEALRQANDALQARETSVEAERQRLTSILSTIPAGVAIADSLKRTIIYNPAGAAMLSVKPDVEYNLDEMARRYADIQVKFDVEASGLFRALRGDLVQGYERDIRFPDGRRLVILASAAPLRDPQTNEIIGAAAAFVDITQLKQLQAQLDSQRRDAEEASIRKSRFLAAVSHDIRTPANAISLLADLLQRAARSPSLAAEIPNIVEDLKSSAFSLVRLVSDVLDLTRFDSGHVELVESEFPLAQLMHDECRQFAQAAREKGIAVTCELPDSIMIRIDRVKLSRVLNNLVGNAVKFTNDGSIRLDGGRMPNGCVQIRVTDTGPGIPAEHHEKIFDEFFQLKTHGHEKGSGLGLAICRRLATAMGLKLELQSDSGKGTTFTVTLPPTCVVRSA
jgi:signal transduction histidine kinase